MSRVKQQSRRARRWRMITAVFAAGLAGSGPALALPNLGGAGLGLGALTQPLNRLDDSLQPLDSGTTAALSPPNLLADVRGAHIRQLLRDNPRVLDTDEAGQLVVRGEVLALSPSPASLAVAQAAGFTVLRRDPPNALGVDLVVLSAPDGVRAREALKHLRKLDPDGRYDLDHIYTGAGAAEGAGVAKGGLISVAGGVRVGLLDTGVDRDHPAFAACQLEQRGFAPGGVVAGDHGTAVASLLVGREAKGRPPERGAMLFVADVYGGGPTGGSADDIIRALSWMVENRVPVINVSLVGPSNLTLEAAVRAVLLRGSLIVAPVGNDGPAAPPLYPASYPGVIAVTAVDGRGRLLFEAGRARHVDFVAPGADIQAARVGGGYGAVRGTSFAAPIVAGRLARLLREPDRARAAQAVSRLAAQTRPIGDPAAFGRGRVEAPSAPGC